MNDIHDDLRRVLAALEEPEPPGALRAGALDAAGDAWERPTADRWLALWESRPLRLAWAAVVVALAAANVGVRLATHAGVQARREPTARADASNRELHAIVALPRLRPEYANASTAGPATAAPAAEAAHQRSENKS